jgi:acyl-CoA synthetase (AMP-forming)/AMP-acid ligase II
MDSVGRPASPFIELDIVDGNGSRRPRGRLGEIVVRSAMSTSVYWQGCSAGDDAFLPGDWFRSHDLGFLDAAIAKPPKMAAMSVRRNGRRRPARSVPVRRLNGPAASPVPSIRDLHPRRVRCGA